MEEYKIIEGFENYSISNFGNVKNNNTGKIRKFQLDHDGYYIVSLHNNWKRKTFRVHRLVALTFIPNPENKPQIDHIDNDRINNNENNLRWCTHSENQINTGIAKNNTSGVKGVRFYKQHKKWCAQITHNGKKHHLGLFNTIEEATKTRQKKAKELFGEFVNAIELEININNIKPNTKLKLNININNDEQKEIEELEREFQELIK